MCVGACNLALSDTETETSSTKEVSTAKTEEKKKEVKVEGTISATQLVEEYAANEVKADKLYKDKLYEITGKVCNISVVLGSMSLSLEGDEFGITNVHLSLEDSQKDIVAELEDGQEITIQGTIEGLGWDVNVKDVKFIKY
jgi:hypothetical protein